MEELPPYSIRSAEGRPSGYAVELLRLMLKRSELEARFDFSSWPRVLARARAEPNILLPAIVRLPEREAQFLWLGQIAQRRSMLYRLRSRGDVQLHRLDDAKAWLTAVIAEDVAERELVARGFEPSRHLDRSGDYAVLLRKFFAGRSQLLALNEHLAPALLQRYGYEPDSIEPALAYAEARPSMALSLGSRADWHERLRQALAELRRDGGMAAVAARYPAIALPPPA